MRWGVTINERCDNVMALVRSGDGNGRGPGGDDGSRAAEVPATLIISHNTPPYVSANAFVRAEDRASAIDVTIWLNSRNRAQMDALARQLYDRNSTNPPLAHTLGDRRALRSHGGSGCDGAPVFPVAQPPGGADGQRQLFRARAGHYGRRRAGVRYSSTTIRCMGNWCERTTGSQHRGTSGVAGAGDLGSRRGRVHSSGRRACNAAPVAPAAGALARKLLRLRS